MNNFFKKLTLKVDKRILLLVTGLVWGFAGFKVLTLGVEGIKINNPNWIFILLFATLVFYIFFKFIFSKMFKKHIKRIINNTLQKHCILSFFDVKSYFIMGFMIFFGVTIRSLDIFNPVYLGTFYIGLGSALFMAGFSFLISSLKFENTILKYRN
ncbi:EscU/YscU/HrcU family type III secretion system export apparatus switch protein [Clostridium sporogenes]|uniref:EscU/YscU/HrcU family type III secretion system export apparatus switch protein n=1 Tax=Clostridium sporogenes TaxID=1509 RepID=UPI0013D7EA22|nr:EscU/YscU/HrcU family type III secretion system export apparatus switch protein [Clostridium sporogenes]NFP89994.1 EscU/YscU/HrcU family type III secretion system export apparatus switch protein [Clostridium sporogenes]